MKESTYAAVDTLITRYPALAVCAADVRAAVEALVDSYRAGGKLIVWATEAPPRMRSTSSVN